MSGQGLSSASNIWIEATALFVEELAMVPSGIFPLRAPGLNLPPFVPHIILQVDDSGKAKIQRFALPTFMMAMTSRARTALEATIAEQRARRRSGIVFVLITRGKHIHTNAHPVDDNRPRLPGQDLIDWMEYLRLAEQYTLKY